MILENDSNILSHLLRINPMLFGYTKKEVLDVFQDFCNMDKKQFNISIKVLRTDDGIVGIFDNRKNRTHRILNFLTQLH
jgi:hypothetical protein